MHHLEMMPCPLCLRGCLPLLVSEPVGRVGEDIRQMGKKQTKQSKLSPSLLNWPHFQTPICFLSGLHMLVWRRICVLSAHIKHHTSSIHCCHYRIPVNVFYLFFYELTLFFCVADFVTHALFEVSNLLITDPR